MTNYLSKALKFPDLKKKIFFTFAILALYRFLSHIPVPNVDTNALKVFFDSNQYLSFLNVFTGGGLRNLSIIALGVMPYINASIVMQLMTMAIPKLEELSKEGAYGQQKINQYTQALTLPLTLIQGYIVYFTLSRQQIGGVNILPDLGPFDLLLVIATMSAGTFLLMWLGERITENGVGQGMSVIILAGILAGIPSSIGSVLGVADAAQFFNILVFIAVGLTVIAGVVYVNEAFRKIEVQYSSRIRGGQSYGGGNSFIPVKINQAGVIPIIFAVTLVLIPSALATYLQKSSNAALLNIGTNMAAYFQPSSVVYNVFYFFLVFAFTYFYTSITFNPTKIADDIRKGGGFIPGVRPGRATIEYLTYVIRRLTLAGGVFLGLVAILPSIIQGITNISSLAVGGTGLLIVVSVILETVKQVESQVITREYESFTQ